MFSQEQLTSHLHSELLAVSGQFPGKWASVSCDSRRCGANTLFAAIRGTARNGNDFLAEAAASGCRAVLTADAEAPIPAGMIRFLVKDDRKAAAMAFSLASGLPDRSLRLFGVTGTNGKTTTAFALHALLSTAGKCGLLSTVCCDDGTGKTPARWTTPAPEALFPAFRRMADNGCAFCAMELSSQALDQQRMGDALFESAVFTNLTGDHLDYHRDTEHYFAAKKRLFFERLSSKGFAVCNADDPCGKQLAQELGAQAESFSFAPGAKHRIEIQELSLTGSRFLLDGIPFFCSLPGKYNISNFSGALLSAMGSGLAPDRLAGTLETLSVPGRLERCTLLPGRPVVFVDFAHTDDALTNVLSFLRGAAPHKKLVAVFGAGGDRDKTKRLRMGRAVSKLADFAVLTSDNPRTEDPLAILSMMEAGIQGGDYILEPDRRAAITRGIREAGADGIVLIAGKGHEATQEIAGVQYPFSDRETAEEFLHAEYEEKTI